VEETDDRGRKTRTTEARDNRRGIPQGSSMRLRQERLTLGARRGLRATGFAQKVGKIIGRELQEDADRKERGEIDRVLVQIETTLNLLEKTGLVDRASEPPSTPSARD
jgi:RNA-directed DNA polymerase